jgi:hypothetical protein
LAKPISLNKNIQSGMQKMRLLTSGIIVLTSAGLLLLGACSKEAKTTDSANSTATPPTAENTPSATTSKPMGGMEKSHMAPRKGGQVVESGKYHLELVPEKEGDNTHLDFYVLAGEKHEPVATANVTADLQLPDGKQKTIPLKYDPAGKHYAATLAEKAMGKYQVKIFATIGSEKVDGRFSFDR